MIVISFAIEDLHSPTATNSASYADSVSLLAAQ